MKNKKDLSLLLTNMYQPEKEKSSYKIRKIKKIQKDFLLVYMFLYKTKLNRERTNLHEIYEDYTNYVKKIAGTRFLLGKMYFASIIQKLGAIRKRTKGPSFWVLLDPSEMDPEDLLRLIKEEEERIKSF